MHIVLRDVTKSYFIGKEKIEAVRNVSLEIQRKEFISIIGHSGSGKTTFLSIIGGVARPTSGTVLFEDKDIYSFDKDKLSEYRCEKIGFIFQFASLLPNLTAKENVLLPVLFKTHGHRNTAGSEKKAIELLHMTGVGDKVHAYPSQLSGGQQRRVAIARAFINNPEVILADEPTGDLDEETEMEIMLFFRRMNEDAGITFVMVTHNSELARTTGRQLKMGNGLIGTVAHK
jgi:putative ABC transport system ATP-binding protein/lipoprotein-releasing system ATP-binding protein